MQHGIQSSRANYKRLALIGGLVIIGAVLIFYALKPAPDPVYNGKRVSEWIRGHVSTTAANPPFNSPGWLEADKALREIGTNGIPVYLEMLRAKDPPKFVFKIIDFVERHISRVNYHSGMTRNEEAEYAFTMLGTNGACAVPELIRIYEEAISPSSQRCTASSLHHIGQPAAAAIPVFLKHLTDTNDEVRYYAVTAFCHIKGDPKVIVPALVSMLKDRKAATRYNALSALQQYGSEVVRAAIPALLEATNDPALKSKASCAIWGIAPEKIAPALVVEEPTPMVANGVTREALWRMQDGHFWVLIATNKTVPCGAFAAVGRQSVSLYRGLSDKRGEDFFLGEFEVVDAPAPPADVNIEMAWRIEGQRILLCAYEYKSERFLHLRRVDSGVVKTNEGVRMEAK